jgi:hypothetical protein
LSTTSRLVSVVAAAVMYFADNRFYDVISYLSVPFYISWTYRPAWPRSASSITAARNLEVDHGKVR